MINSLLHQGSATNRPQIIQTCLLVPGVCLQPASDFMCLPLVVQSHMAMDANT